MLGRKLAQIYLLSIFPLMYSVLCVFPSPPPCFVPPVLAITFWAATPSFTLIAELKKKSWRRRELQKESERESVREREWEKRPFIKPAANWDSTKIMGSDTLMKTCYVLPLLPSFPSTTERRRRCNEENKEVGRDEENMKKDRRRVRASTVLLQKGGKKE